MDKLVDVALIGGGAYVLTQVIAMIFAIIVIFVLVDKVVKFKPKVPIPSTQIGSGGATSPPLLTRIKKEDAPYMGGYGAHPNLKEQTERMWENQRYIPWQQNMRSGIHGLQPMQARHDYGSIPHYSRLMSMN